MIRLTIATPLRFWRRFSRRSRVISGAPRASKHYPQVTSERKRDKLAFVQVDGKQPRQIRRRHRKLRAVGIGHTDPVQVDQAAMSEPENQTSIGETAGDRNCGSPDAVA